MRSNLDTWQNQENISLELGPRVATALASEVGPASIILGVSIIKWADMLECEYLAGDPMGIPQALNYLPWDGIWAGDNKLRDFRLIDGLRIMYHDVMEGDLSPWALARWFPEYEEELVAYDEALARDEWEQWVAEGGMDNEP